MAVMLGQGSNSCCELQVQTSSTSTAAANLSNIGRPMARHLWVLLWASRYWPSSANNNGINQQIAYLLMPPGLPTPLHHSNPPGNVPDGVTACINAAMLSIDRCC